MIVLNLYFDANKVGRARWSDLTNKCQLCNFYEIIPGKYIMQYYGGGRDGGEVKKKKWRFRGEEWKRGKETRRKLQEKLSKCQNIPLDSPVIQILLCFLIIDLFWWFGIWWILNIRSLIFILCWWSILVHCPEILYLAWYNIQCPVQHFLI